MYLICDMDIFSLCGCAVVACVLIITVRQQRPDIALVLTVAVSVILFAYMAADLQDAVSGIYDIIGGLSKFRNEAEIVFKAVGVCLVTQLASDVCRDCGQNTVASRVELGGRVAVVLLLIPLLGEIVEISASIIG